MIMTLRCSQKKETKQDICIGVWRRKIGSRWNLLWDMIWVQMKRRIEQGDERYRNWEVIEDFRVNWSIIITKLLCIFFSLIIQLLLMYFINKNENSNYLIPLFYNKVKGQNHSIKHESTWKIDWVCVSVWKSTTESVRRCWIISFTHNWWSKASLLWW